MLGHRGRPFVGLAFALFLMIIGLVSLSTPSVANGSTPSVTENVTITVANSRTQGSALSISGCHSSVTTIAMDGAPHSFTADPSCSITFTVPTDAATSRYRFSGALTTWSYTTAASGTDTKSNTLYLELLLDASYSAVSGTPSGYALVLSYTTDNTTSAYTLTPTPTAVWPTYNGTGGYTVGDHYIGSTERYSQNQNTTSFTASATVVFLIYHQYIITPEGTGHPTYDCNQYGTSETSLSASAFCDSGTFTIVGHAITDSGVPLITPAYYYEVNNEYLLSLQGPASSAPAITNGAQVSFTASCTTDCYFILPNTAGNVLSSITDKGVNVSYTTTPIGRGNRYSFNGSGPWVITMSPNGGGSTSTTTLVSTFTTTIITQNESQLNSLNNAVSTLNQKVDQLSANQSVFSALTVIAIIGLGAVLVVIIMFRSKGKRGTRTDNWDLFD